MRFKDARIWVGEACARTRRGYFVQLPGSPASKFCDVVYFCILDGLMDSFAIR